MKKGPIVPEDLLAVHTLKITIITKKLQKIIKGVMPGAKEKIYMGWHAIGYTHPKAGYLCAIFLLRDCVKLGFEYGMCLNDPKKILKAGPSMGNKVRYLEFKDTQQIIKKEVEGFILESIELRVGQQQSITNKACIR